MLAQLLMAGLDRRALVSAASRLDERRSRDRREAALPVGSQFSFSAGALGSYPPEALDWGIAAFLSGKTKTRGSVKRILTDAEAG